MHIKEIKKCRICGNTSLMPIMDLGNQSLSGRFPSRGDPTPPSGPLQLVKCDDGNHAEACGLLQLRHSVTPDEMFSHHYGYRSGINNTMVKHLTRLVEEVTGIVPLSPGDVVLDIGSNDATLLKSYRQPGLKRLGIDPTGKYFAQYYPPDIALVSDYFTSANYVKAMGHEKAKIITSIAMFYDLDDPNTFVEDIRKALHRDGMWVFEQSYMPTMLKQNSFDTVCHEHLEYYALKQIRWLMERHHLRIVDVSFNSVNGGSFRLSVCHEKASYASHSQLINSILSEEEQLHLDTEQPFMAFVTRVNAIRSKLFTFITQERKKGKSIYVYGASTKGNVLLQYCNLDSKLITAAAERNPEKFGKRTPTTDIPIISEEEARKAKPDYFLVLPWHFRDEFLLREKKFLHMGGKLIFPLPEVEVVGEVKTDAL